MKNSLLVKGAALFVIVLLLLISLAMVRDAISERAAYQAEVSRDIAHHWGESQTVIGPLLLQRYEVQVKSEVWDKNLEAYVEKSDWEVRRSLTFPQQLVVDGNIVVEQRYRGIYTVPVYRGDISLAGTLRIPDAPVGARNVENSLLLGVSDIRGFRRQPVILWQGEPLEVVPGADALPGGVHARLAESATGPHEVNIELSLAGSNHLQVAPIGDDTQVSLASNWPHPGFGGGYLPEQREISDTGFTAHWQTSHYATTIRDALNACVSGDECALHQGHMIAVALPEPVNVYLLNERSTKYGLLFILIVFGVFLVYELLKGLRIHPVQYGLVGLGLAMFFLLLLSLSEHLAFGLAYFIGAVACVVLLSLYVSYVLGAWTRAFGFGAMLSAVYGALYIILQSEDRALLLGSLLLFALLAAAMLLTRNIDWYSVGVPKHQEGVAT